MNNQAAPRTWCLDLQWKKPPLSLNDRRNRYREAELKRTIRFTGGWLAKKAGIPQLTSIHVQLHYVPVDNRTRDSDNLIATQKPLIDGLKDSGVVIDDSPAYVSWSRPQIHPGDKTNPRMWLEITEGARP